jgi:hypothetical protein
MEGVDAFCACKLKVEACYFSHSPNGASSGYSADDVHPTFSRVIGVACGNQPALSVRVHAIHSAALLSSNHFSETSIPITSPHEAAIFDIQAWNQQRDTTKNHPSRGRKRRGSSREPS